MLSGLDALRPLAAAGAHPLGDVALLKQLGGAEVVRKLAELAGVGAPLIDLDGPGAAATAANASKDLALLLSRVQLGDATLQFASQPADAPGAIMRLYEVLRAAQLGYGGGELAKLTKPPPGLLKDVKEVPAKASAKVYLRAMPAAALEPLTEEAVWRREASESREPYASDEARRLIGAYGRPAYSALTSNLHTTGELSGQIPASLFACVTGLQAMAQADVLPLVGAVRRADADNDLRTYAADLVSGDNDLDRVVKLAGAQAPSVDNAAGIHDGSLELGTWGATTGADRARDLERAMGVFGATCVKIFHDALGGPPPRKAGYGLQDLARKALRRLTFEDTLMLFRSLFSAVSSDGQMARGSASAPVVDWEQRVEDADRVWLQRMTDIAVSRRSGRDEALLAIAEADRKRGGLPSF